MSTAPIILLTLLLTPLATRGLATEALPTTLMTTRGKLLASENFDMPPAAFAGKPAGFASGYTGWRYNARPTDGKSGRWELHDGLFTGIESPGAHHPATASFGIRFKDAIVQCEVRIDDVPAEGRPYRSLFVKATDAKDYVCALSVGTGGLNALAYDDSRINPKTKQREKSPPVRAAAPVKLNEWHIVVLEIQGEELVASLDGRSVALSSPLLDGDKHSIMLGAGTQASFRNFRMWEALPNPDWPKNKQALVAQAAKPPAGAKPAASVADAFHAEKLAALDATIEQAIRELKIIGAAVWVERNGAAYHKAFGQRALQPAPEVMTEDTIFDVASITKVAATASAAMLCVERGLLALEDPLSRHVPAFTGEGREKITIRHLLLHTSGLRTNLDAGGRPFTHPAEAVALACSERPLFEPGSAFSYSSIGAMLVATAVERATGRAFDEFCTTELYRPLRMQDTLFRPQGGILRRVSPSSAPERGQVDDLVARAMGGVAGHASLFTTTPDLARFARMMLNQGELDGARVLQAGTVKLMTSVQSPAGLASPATGNLPVRRGLGWDINTPYRTPPHDYSLQRGALFPVGGYGHAGWTGQSLWIDPFSRTFVVFLCNRYQGRASGSPQAVYRLHHRIATLAAEAVKGFDFNHVPGALPRAPAQ